METRLTPDNIEIILSVLILPMRNGNNITDEPDNEISIKVLILPMRNGNLHRVYFIFGEY